MQHARIPCAQAFRAVRLEEFFSGMAMIGVAGRGTPRGVGNQTREEQAAERRRKIGVA
jgi:hypothetical protein